MPTLSRSKVRRISAATSASASSRGRHGKAARSSPTSFSWRAVFAPASNSKRVITVGPELTAVEFQGDPICRRGSPLQEVDEYVAVSNHHRHDLRSASAVSRRDLASWEGMVPFRSTARFRCASRSASAISCS